MCDYLLSNVDHSQRDDQMHGAMGIFHSIGGSNCRAQILELFASKYNMDVYIFGPNDDAIRGLKNEFYDLSKIVLSHQPISLEKVPVQDRFNVAMKLRGRPPKDFLATVVLDIGDQLLHMTDECGATALHWAALHWSMGHRRGWPSSRRAGHGDFVVALVKAGSSVSAIDNHGHTPLMYLLDWDRPGDWNYGTYHMPDRLCPLRFMSSWATLLANAGVSMPEYVARENSILSHLEAAHPVEWRWRGETMELESIALGSQTTLIMSVHRVKGLYVYERRPPPGSFAHLTTNLRVRWHPWYSLEEDDHYLSWQFFDYRTLRSSQPCLLSHDSIDDVVFDLGQILFGDTKDDHATLTAVYRRHQQRLDRQRHGLLHKRRSSSTPPAARNFYPHVIDVPVYHNFDGRQLRIHKCPLDGQWGFTPDRLFVGEEYHPMWAICLKGCLGRPDLGADIVNAFFPHKRLPVDPRERWLIDTFPRQYGSKTDLW